MEIFLGSDHAGYELKNQIQEYLKSKKLHVVDLGVFNTDPADYPEIGREVAEKVAENHGARGILFCGTGVGICMAANKVRGVRAANVESKLTAEMSRRHNDANVLCLGARVTPLEQAKEMVDIFLRTEFESGEERHVRRVKKIEPQQP